MEEVFSVTVLGIDPGYAIVGYGVINLTGNSYKILGYGTATTKASDPLPDRLLQIYNDITQVIEMYKPDAVAIEELFFNTNITTGIAVSEGRGVILLACKQAGLPIFEYTPLQVKQAICGYGRAEKKQVMEMTRRMLNLEKIPRPDDAADALALAICHAHMKRNGESASVFGNTCK